VPVHTEFSADYETPLSAFHKIDDGRHSFLLESAESTSHGGRYSIVGSAPRVVFEARGKAVRITDVGGGETRAFVSERDPLHDLEDLMAEYRPAGYDDLPVFFGGAVGYLAYDAVRYFEPTVPPPPKDELGLPDMAFMVTDTVLIFDHRFRKLKVVCSVLVAEGEAPEAAYARAGGKIRVLVDALARPCAARPLNLLLSADRIVPRSNTTREEYMGMVGKAKEYILAGDVFQVVPSQRFEIDFPGDPLDLYRALRSVNPSPYMFCLRFPDGFALVGCSPEVHVRAINRRIEIRPIAGTRPRGATEVEDDALAAELLADPKERAEHIMLVDLARNDVGRVSEFGSVSVDDFMVIERYSHVMHIVSNVSGRLAGGKTAYDVMRATFPAGTVSGSPKVRAMQVINELEKSKRCAYSGAVGYFGFDGNHDSCIALRTAVLKDGKAYVQAGAGIVADSVPESEYAETVNKAMGLVRAIERAAQLLD